jgi:diguanylate cyclase (GGDEF)-like protein
MERALKDLVRVSRALTTLSAGNHTLLHASDEHQLLQDMCRVIVETGGYRTASIAYAEHDENKSLRWMASVGFEKELLASFNLTWDERLGRTAGPVAIRTGKPIVGELLLTNPAYAHWRDHAVELGLAAAAAFPLLVEGEVLGFLAMAAGEPDAFDDEEVTLLTEMADDLAFGIANLRIRERHREAQATIARLAYYDSLTDLPNHTRLLELLHDVISTAGKEGHGLALLQLHIGEYREINKVLGYRAGNQLLQQLTRRLTLTAEPDETLARVSEADFALLLPRASAEYAIHVAQRLLAALHQPVEVAGLLVDPGAAVGIALYPGHAVEAEALLRCAEAASHDASPGTGGYAFYAGGHEQEFANRLALMGEFRRAIDDNELVLYCQPKVDMRSRRVCGAEALVRWQHPVHGLLPPIEFIKLAEHAGLITPLTNWVLEAAFHQSHAWQEAGLDQALSVNLSAHDLSHPGLIDRIRGLFSTWGIAPERIQFELTESALLSDPAGALATLSQLKQLGIRLFIDDFGTGYSSLSYLQQLPVDSIKIDQSFVMPMMNSGNSAIIVHSTIELGHNMKLEVVAEGVESQPVWDRLAGLGCDVAQGYLVSMPMPAAQFKAWKAQWAH